jgi:hypothetical protein
MKAYGTMSSHSSASHFEQHAAEVHIVSKHKEDAKYPRVVSMSLIQEKEEVQPAFSPS